MSDAQQDPSARSGLGTAWQAGGVGAIGLWLLFLYIVTTALVILSLSAFQVQDKIRGFTVGDKSYSVGEMVRLLEIWEARRLKIDEATQRASAAQVTLGDAERNLDAADGAADRLWGRYLEAEDVINRALAYLEGTSTSNWKDMETAEVLEIVSAKRPNYQSETSFQDAYGKFIAAIDDFNKAQRDLGAAEKRQRTTMERLKSAEAQLASLQVGYGAGGATAATGELSAMDAGSLGNPGVQDLLNELQFFRRFMFGLTYQIATMPASLLTLILTLSMGTLGSVLFLTRIFFSGAGARGFSWYLFRPFLGMITALAVFVLAKAGVLVIANPSEAGIESGDINPFFISFLAIVSGLLSEQATLRIQSAGERFFRVDDADAAADPGRWALAVKQEMDRQGKAAGELAALLEVEDEQVDDWLEERAPVPEATQLVIAAWLNKRKRELFTDLGPA